MGKKPEPFIAAGVEMKEFSARAVLLGIVLSVLLAAANIYFGLKTGMTVAAAFPAAVISTVVFRVFGGTILEENICRATAVAGAAVAAGAVFTLPAFLIAEGWGSGGPLWKNLRFLESALLVLGGGVLGVVLAGLLRRVFMQDLEFPFPESIACAETVKAGRNHGRGARCLFGGLGFGALAQFFRSPHGLKLFSESTGGFFSFGPSETAFFHENTTVQTFAHQGGIYLQSPEASPALIGVGYIIGPRLSSAVFSGGVLAWFVFVPLVLFLRAQGLIETFGFDETGRSAVLLPGPGAGLITWAHTAEFVWSSYVRPFAVGSLIVAAIHALRQTALSVLVQRKWKWSKGSQDSPREASGSKKNTGENRLQKDLPLRPAALLTLVSVILVTFVYYIYCKSIVGAFIAAAVVTASCLLFAAVAFCIAGATGSSRNPIFVSALFTGAVVGATMTFAGIKGDMGIAVALGAAVVVCCFSVTAGDVMQELKTGGILGGTPWKMGIACIIGGAAAAVAAVFILMWIHKTSFIGGWGFAAPHAGLAAVVTQGINGQTTPWPLAGMGAFFTTALIFMRAPSPTLTAIGMYLPFTVTAAVFLGGIARWTTDRMLVKQFCGEPETKRAEETGTLLASGFVAGEALMGAGLAGLVILGLKFPAVWNFAWPGGAIILIAAAVLIFIPLKRNDFC